jgi:hypothetical protein
MPTALRKLTRESFMIVMPIWILLFSALAVSAQGNTFTPITIGENLTGEITAAAPSAGYAITVASPQAVQIQVFSITQGFAPSIQVFDPSGLVIQTALNPTGETAVQVMPLLTSAGQYQIVVQSANGQVGQFLISAQAGPALQPPQPLVVGQSLPGNVSSETPFQMYSFPGSETDVLLLTVYSDVPTSGPIVLLTDADTRETLALNSARMAGARYRIPSGPANYLVQVSTSGAATAETYVICLENENGPFTCPAGVQAAVIPTIAAPVATQVPLPPLPSTGPCVVASSSGGPINVRSGPGTNFTVVSQLTGSATAAVIGRLPDNSWYQVNVGGIAGWVSATVVRIGGECGGVAAVTLTPTTGAATATGTLATATATVTGTLVTATATASATATQPPPVATLNFSLPSIYGSTSLTSGFVPDPFTVGVSAGGDVNVSYLGGGCTGYTTSGPSFSVNYTSGAFPTLRFYFISGAGDSTMIINTPGGSYACVDDSFGTLNPTIDFNSPASGRYDVWVGSYQAATSLGGTLYITENTANRP